MSARRRPRVKCDLCGAWLNAANLADHMARIHPEGEASDEQQQALLHRRMKARRAAAANVARKAVPVLVVALLLAVGGYWFFIYEASPEDAPPWELNDTGVTHLHKSSEYYPNGLVLLEFMHTQCGYCEQMASVLNDIYANYSSELAGMFTIGGYQISGGSKDNVESLHNFRTEHNHSWPFLWDHNADDPDLNLMRAYGTSSFPTIILIDEGKIVWMKSGEVSYSRVAKEIDNYLD